MAKKYSKPVSLYPLKFEDAVSALLRVKPVRNSKLVKNKPRKKK